MTQNPTGIKIIGALSALPSAYFWVGAAMGFVSKIQFPYNPGVIILFVGLSMPASIWAAVRWSRWMYALTVFAALTILVVIFSLG
jgi:hypothetical protein